MPVPKDYIFRGDPLPPVTEKSVGEEFHKALREHKEKVALIHAETNEQVTYSEILDRSEHLALWLQSRGIKPGDVIGICSENSLEFPLPVLASQYMGVICATVNSTYTVRELLHSLNLSKPKVVFCSKLTEELVHETVKKLNFVKDIVVLAQKAEFKGHKSLSEILNQQIDRSSFRLHEVERPENEVGFIFYSSGTTGLAKGVMITHANVLYLMAMHEHRYAASPDELVEKTVGFLPMFHVYGIAVLLISMKHGKTLVVVPKFSPELFLKLIQNYKLESIPVVPPIITFLAKHPMVDDYDLTSLKRLSVGAAPVSREILNDLLIRMPWIENIRQGYGLTEFTLSGISNTEEKSKLGSVGITAPGIETKVTDPSTGKTLGPGQSGEICFRGPLIMKGYIDNPKATAEAIDTDGWLHTGDIGYYDEDGFFYIVDRLKELIKYKGFQVPPAELEAILLSHSAVMEAAVIGIPHKRAGEVPRAFVVKKAPVTEKELLKFVDNQVSSPKRLRGGIRFVESIPKTSSGKILRRELRKLSKNKL